MRLLTYPSTWKILFSLEKSAFHFSELLFETRLRPRLLSRRLEEMARMGIVREKDSVYELTPKGKELVEALKEVLFVLGAKF